MSVKTKRRRASAIVQHPQGIVLVLMQHLAAMLPGEGTFFYGQLPTAKARGLVPGAPLREAAPRRVAG